MSFAENFTAQPGDIDELNHVNNAVWVRWIQEIAVNHWRAVAASAHVDAFFWVVVRHEVDYLGNMGLGDTAEGRTWVGDAPRGARFDRMVEFSRDGRVLVKARTTWVIVDKETGKIKRVPPEVAAPFLD
jgi:acyl-CoA thioester hydrolase